MHTATLHGIGVITKLYFAIFCGIFKGINDLESRSEVISGHAFWRQSKVRVRLYIGQWNGPQVYDFDSSERFDSFERPLSMIQNL